MSYRADFYEAMTWLALEDIYKGVTQYEPDREQHSCGMLCEHKKICHKPKDYKRLIYTIPDFLVAGSTPRFLHVCYWDSKETSHAKFWRTISELCDLKRYIPNSVSTCVVFEAQWINGEYRSDGWYPDFLRSFRELFDECVFFNHRQLSEDLLKGEKLNAPGTDKLHNSLRNIDSQLHSLKSLAESIVKPLRPLQVTTTHRSQLWASERSFCSHIQLRQHAVVSFDRLRNAMLQIVLIDLLYPELGSCSAVVSKLSDWSKQITAKEDLLKLHFLSRMPIEDRNGEFAFVVNRIEEEIDGTTRAVFSEDLELFLDARRRNSLGISLDALAQALTITHKQFAVSGQVNETVDALHQFSKLPDLNALKQCSPTQLWAHFVSVPKRNEYNSFAELLIEATHLGTYPLVGHINLLDKTLAATRNDIRGLYSNRRPVRDTKRYPLILKAIAKLMPKDLDVARLKSGYLLRKTHRIIGPQSAINPLEELVRCIFENQSWKKDTSIISNQELATLVTDCSKSDQAGNWRVSLCVKKGADLFPIFISGMKSPADCGHKTREFCAHLSMARYRLIGDQLKSSNVKRGIAVLEGGYGPEERQAFELAGFDVCTLATIPQTLTRLGLSHDGQTKHGD